MKDKQREREGGRGAGGGEIEFAGSLRKSVGKRASSVSVQTLKRGTTCELQVQFILAAPIIIAIYSR